MTDRHAGYIVVLESSLREDDAKEILAALSMVRGVLSVSPVIDDSSVFIAWERARAEVREKVFNALNDL